MRVVARWETALTTADHDALSALLCAAFPGPEFAPGRSWPASYGRKEARIWLTADADDAPLAHLGLERRTAGADGTDILIAGIGDVAVSPARHGRGLGAALMRALDDHLAGPFTADFAFVQCRDTVAGFYRATGWTPVANPVRHLAIGDQRSIREGRWPTFIRPARRPLTDWPDGLIDLRGLPW